MQKKKWEYSSTGTTQAGNWLQHPVAKDTVMESKPLEVSIIIITLAQRNRSSSNKPTIEGSLHLDYDLFLNDPSKAMLNVTNNSCL